MAKNEKRERERWLRAFGQAVRERRLQLGVSQEKLGFLSGLDRTYVSALERGVRNPTVLVLWKVAKGLEATLGEILGRAEEITRASGGD